MSSQHLSDEAVAAFADAVLSGSARERATRHVNGCPECARAVAVQREAITALRAATAPSLPGSLLDRLRHVPTTTPLDVVATTIGPDGSAMFPAYGTAGSGSSAPFGAMAAQFAAAALPFASVGFVASAEPDAAGLKAVAQPARRRKGHGPMAFTFAALTAAGVLAAGSVPHGQPGPATRSQPRLSAVFAPADQDSVGFVAQRLSARSH